MGINFLLDNLVNNYYNTTTAGNTSSTGVAYDLISEGPIELVGGLSGVYFNRTPVVNESLSLNTQANEIFTTIAEPSTGVYQVTVLGNIPATLALPIIVLEGFREATVTSHTSTTVTVGGFFDPIMVNGAGDNGTLRPRLRIQGANLDGSEYVGSVVSYAGTTAVVSPPIPGNATGKRISFDHVTTGATLGPVFVFGQLYNTTFTLASLPNAAALIARGTRIVIDSLSSNLPGAASDKKNFKYAQINFRPGTLNQTPVANLPSFTSASLGFAKNTEIKQHTSYINVSRLNNYWGKNKLRFPKDAIVTGGPEIRILGSEVAPGAPGEVDELLLTISTPNGLYGLNDEGDTYPWGVTFQIWFEYQKAGQAPQRALIFGPTDAEIASATSLVSSNNATFRKFGPDTTGTIRASSKTAMDFDFRWSVEQFKPFVNFAVEVKKVTPDALDYNEVDTITANTSVKALQAFINDKLSYPNSAYAAIAFDSLEFAGNFPERAYRCRGVRMDLPTNYITREEASDGIAKYNRQSNGVVTNQYQIWDGTFRRGYSNNPVWNLREMLLNKRWGLGHWVDESLINNYSFYSLARYCDELVPDGNGGLEPRFTCGVYLTEPVEAYKIIRDFCTMMLSIPYWVDGQMLIEADRPAEPVYTFTKGNIEGGLFSYEGTGNKTRPNQIAVRFNNKDNFYEQDLELVDDVEDMVKQNRIFTEEVTAFGATTRGQAVRYGKWKLLTSKLQKEVVSFKTGENAAYLKPGSIVNIQDADRNSVRYSGRLVSATTNSVVVDSAVVLGGDEYTLHVFIEGPAVYLVQDTVTLSEGTFNRGDLLPFTIGGTLIDSEEEASKIVDTAGNPVDVQFVDGAHIESKIISSYTGATINITGNFTSAPAAETVWAITQKRDGALVAGSAKQYKILSIGEESPGLYNITAAEHFNSKFDLIDEDFIATSPRTVPRYDELPPIADFSAKVITTRGTSDSLTNLPTLSVRLNWMGPLTYINNISRLDSRVEGFVLEIVNPLGETSIQTLLKSDTSYTIVNAIEGRYEFTLRAKNSQGPMSPPARISMAVEVPSSKSSNVVATLPRGGTFNKPINISTDSISTPSSYRFTADSGVSVIYSATEPKVTPGTYWHNGTRTVVWDGVRWVYVSGVSAPIFASDSSTTFAENGTGIVYTAIAGGTEPITYSISGTDAANFSINGSTGDVTFTAPPNFESPTDTNLNNIYNIVVTATNTTGTSTLNVAITVTNVAE